MSTVTELSLFKQCVEKPQFIQNLGDLNLDRIPDPTDFQDLSESELLQKKGLKLFHMVWSGTTKYLRTTCQDKGKPVEFPGLGIFNPITVVSEGGSRLNTATLGALNSEKDIEVYIHQGFLDKCKDALQITNKSGKIHEFNSQDPQSAPLSAVTHKINLASIAKVCDTDIHSVEMIYKEIILQLVHQISKGKNFRLSLKIGRLASRNNEINWKSFTDDGKCRNDTESRFSQNTYQTSYGRQSVGSCKRRNLSVFTPSVQKSRASTIKSSRVGNRFHCSNPNPQLSDKHFRGVRDVGYLDYEKRIDPTDVIKFGKKVDYDKKLSHDEVMQAHLMQMRNHMDVAKETHSIKRAQEKQFLSQVKQLEDLEKSRKLASTKAINNDFVYYNAQMQQEKQQQKIQELAQRQAEQVPPFPYVSGESIERHREVLGAQLKNDLQSYLNFQQGSVKRAQETKSVFSKGNEDASLVGSIINQKFRPLKQLYDSDYVKPDQNDKVFQESHPWKKATFTNALSRFEQELKQRNDIQSSVINDYNKKIQFDEDQMSQEKSNRRIKTKEFNATITAQMNDNEERFKQDKIIAKLPQATGFTPEHEQGERFILLQKKKQQQKMIKNLLNSQMEQRKSQDARNLQDKRDYENDQYESNAVNMEAIKAQKKNDRLRAQNHWQGELARVNASSELASPGKDVTLKSPM